MDEWNYDEIVDRMIKDFSMTREEVESGLAGLGIVRAAK